MFDKTGNCDKFFTYYTKLIEFQKEMLKVTVGEQIEADALELIRKKMVGSLLHGKTLVIFVDSLRPNFKEDYHGTEQTLPEWVFDYQKLKQNFIKIVNDEENYDDNGNKGYFARNPSFAMIILAKYKNEDDIAEFEQMIPYGEQFKKYVVE